MGPVSLAYILRSLELIDLEQQADFFIALAQDDAAIDLLMGELRHSGGSSPMPYLKLLEIYRRRGDIDAHERIRERFNRRFNAHAPANVAEPMAGQSLEAYADAIARLQAAWATPEQAVALAQQKLPEIVLMDLSLPGLNGLEATKLIRKSCPGTAVIILSNYELEDLRDRIRENSETMQAFLNKREISSRLCSVIHSLSKGELSRSS